MATYTRTRRPDNRVVDTCTWCKRPGPPMAEQVSERTWQRRHRCDVVIGLDEETRQIEEARDV